MNISVENSLPDIRWQLSDVSLEIRVDVVDGGSVKHQPVHRPANHLSSHESQPVIVLPKSWELFGYDE